MIVTTILRGGLSNNLFGIAAVLSYSLKHNCDYCIPTEIDHPHYEGQKVFYSKYLKYCNSGIVTAMVYREPHFHYAEIPAPTTSWTLLDGYFQSPKFIEPYREEVLRMLNIRYDFKNGWCSIHVRRGNYLLYPTMHLVISNEYLEAAQIKIMNAGIFKFLVCSDDIDWCKEKMPQFNDCHYTFLKGDEVTTLAMASSCEHNIGSPSSFSWWISYLNRNAEKVSIFPQKDKWFGKDLPHNVDDLYMPEWVLI